MKQEIYYQPTINGELPEQLYSFQVFESRRKCMKWLENNGYDHMQADIHEYKDEDIEEHTYIDEYGNIVKRYPMLDYLKSHIENWESEQAWECIENRMPIPTSLSNKIYDLCEEWCEDNDLPENAWLNTYDDEEDVFMQL